MVQDQVSITRYRGNTFVLPITIYEEDGITPIDVTGATVKFTLDTITEASSGVTVTVGTTDGTINIVVPAVLMAALTEKSYLFDVQMTLDSIVETLFIATLYLLEPLTI
jgi:hypothetical protein